MEGGLRSRVGSSPSKGRYVSGPYLEDTNGSRQVTCRVKCVTRRVEWGGGLLFAFISTLRGGGGC